MSDDPDIDLVTLEVVRAHLIATVREMGKAMIRTAHSSIIYEGHDFSCAILGADGELVAQSEGSPAHIIPLPWQVREALAHYGGRLDDGDVVMVNDPYSSGTHMNDVALIAPFFAAGRRLAIIVVRAHWGDVGGMTAGSISGRATEVFQEGLRIPFTKVYRQGQPVPEILDLVLANVRVPEERDGDFHAMLACCHTARGRLAELAGRFGAERLEAIMSALLDRAERRMRLAIARIRDGTYLYEDYLDSDNVSGRPVLLRVAATVTGEAFHADFAGSAAQVKGPVNCSLAVTAMGTFVALKALLDPKGVINGGGFRPVTVEAPEGTIVNCRHPAATGGFSELRRRVETVVMGALSRAAPDYVAGDVKGATNHTYIASVHPGRGRTTIFYEYPSGGTGGFLEHDGSDTVRAYDEGDFSSIQPAEAVEMEHALLVERTELRTDSCGDGRHRGGLGLRREVRLLAETGSFSELSDRNLIPPYGVSGGHASSPNRFTVLRDGATLQPSDVPGKVSDFPLRQGDVVVMETAGGGEGTAGRWSVTSGWSLGTCARATFRRHAPGSAMASSFAAAASTRRRRRRGGGGSHPASRRSGWWPRVRTTSRTAGASAGSPVPTPARSAPATDRWWSTSVPRVRPSGPGPASRRTCLGARFRSAPSVAAVSASEAATRSRFVSSTAVRLGGSVKRVSRERARSRRDAGPVVWSPLEPYDSASASEASSASISCRWLMWIGFAAMGTHRRQQVALPHQDPNPRPRHADAPLHPQTRPHLAVPLARERRRLQVGLVPWQSHLVIEVGIEDVLHPPGHGVFLRRVRPRLARTTIGKSVDSSQRAFAGCDRIEAIVWGTELRCGVVVPSRRSPADDGGRGQAAAMDRRRRVVEGARVRARRSRPELGGRAGFGPAHVSHVRDRRARRPAPCRGPLCGPDAGAGRGAGVRVPAAAPRRRPARLPHPCRGRVREGGPTRRPPPVLRLRHRDVGRGERSSDRAPALHVRGDGGEGGRRWQSVKATQDPRSRSGR